MSVVTVAIPVGPNPNSCRWLGEAILSVRAQTVPCEILLIDDMHGIPVLHSPGNHSVEWPDVRVWTSPWRLGVAHAFNFGVALASTDEVLMLGADDTLSPDAVECYLKSSSGDEARNRTYYSLPLLYMDTGEVQFQPCNAAVVSKGLWRATGGFPVESASGAPDAAFLSMIWNSDHFLIKSVADHTVYNYRRHDETDTAKRSPWQGVILETRNILTKLFAPPHWGRYE